MKTPMYEGWLNESAFGMCHSVKLQGESWVKCRLMEVFLDFRNVLFLRLREFVACHSEQVPASMSANHWLITERVCVVPLLPPGCPGRTHGINAIMWRQECNELNSQAFSNKLPSSTLGMIQWDTPCSGKNLHHLQNRPLSFSFHFYLPDSEEMFSWSIKNNKVCTPLN